MVRLAIPRPARLMLLAILAGCTTPAPQPQFADLTYSHLAPIRLAVAEVEVVDRYRPPLAAPNVDHRAPVPPAQAMRNWAKDRLVAAGTSVRRAVFTIEEAPIIETELPRTRGLRGAFTKDQSERYDATISVRLEIFDGTGARVGLATASAMRARTVSEDASLNDRQQVWYDMTDQLMQDLNRQLEANIRNLLSDFVV